MTTGTELQATPTTSTPPQSTASHSCPPQSGLSELERSDISPLSRPPLRLLLIMLLLLLAVVPWRKGTYYQGGFDSVVIAKAALNLIAIALALGGTRRGTPWARLPVGPIPLLTVYFLTSAVGALLAENAVATTVLISRGVIVTATVALVFTRYPSGQILSTLTTAMLLLAGFTSATGLGSLATEGRLYGGIPPVNANEIALLVSIPFLCLVWRCVAQLASVADVLMLPVLLGVVWATGTRTGLAALLMATLVLVFIAARIPAYVFSLGVLAVPAVLAVVFYTPVVANYVTRGDATSLLTLNSRTVAWRAALDFPDNATEHFVGVGLSVKKIPVSAMYRSEQILDSTWVSALVQAGRVGTTALALLVLITLVRCARAVAPWRPVCVAVLVLLTLVSALESGLFDASIAFIVFLCFAFAAQAAPEEGDSG